MQTLKPDYVAFVVHPDRIEDNFVGAVFEGLTTLDGDPYLDCAHGYITGETARDALKLVRDTAAAESQPNQIPKKFVAIAHTFAQNDLAPFADQEANRYQAYGYETTKINPIDNSAEWRDKADQDDHRRDWPPVHPAVPVENEAAFGVTQQPIGGQPEKDQGTPDLHRLPEDRPLNLTDPNANNRRRQEEP